MCVFIKKKKNILVHIHSLGRLQTIVKLLFPKKNPFHAHVKVKGKKFKVKYSCSFHEDVGVKLWDVT